MTVRGKDKKQALYIIALLFCLLLGLLLFNRVVISTLSNVRKSTADSVWQSLNFFAMLVYIACFGFLGYKKALKKRLNARFWTIICGIFGIWGYLYLLLFKSNSD